MKPRIDYEYRRPKFGRLGTNAHMREVLKQFKPPEAIGGLSDFIVAICKAVARTSASSSEIRAGRR